MSDEFTLRAWRAGDERAVVELFQRVFQEPYSEALWRWKYAEGPYARPELSVIATDVDGAIVGHGAVFCQPLNLIGRKRSCGQVTDLMIDPAAQRTGVGSAIYTRCVSHIQEAGFEVCLAFPNERSAVGLHWHAAHVAIMEKYVLDLGGPRHAALRALVEAVPEDERLELTYQPELALDGAVDGLAKTVLEQQSLSIHKDAAYLGWRYAAHPEVRYRVVGLTYGSMLMGLAVVKDEGRTLRLLDLLVRDMRVDLAHRLLLAVADAAPEGARTLRFTGRDPWFFEHAFAAFERRPAFSHHVFARTPDRDLAYLYENPLNWTCTLGDCDSH
jgi:predicted N-acetyltransferase YhbS